MTLQLFKTIVKYSTKFKYKFLSRSLWNFHDRKYKSDMGSVYTDSYYISVLKSCEKYANSFQYYQYIIDKIRQIKHVDILPLCEFSKMNSSSGRILIGLRHDIDADPWTGLRCARHLARYGICGSFYLLHTASYYGRYINSRFLRNPQLPMIINGFMVSGAEVGLHIDPLEVYFNYKADGVSAVKKELEWLRSYGLKIRGVVAHNSIGVYGAENYEIFKEHKLNINNRKKKIKRPLGIVSKKELALDYEGTFSEPKKNIDHDAFKSFILSKIDNRDPAWFKKYLSDSIYCNYSVDIQFWLIGKDSWVIVGNFSSEDNIFEHNVGFDRVLNCLDVHGKGKRCLFVLHPIYFSRNSMCS
jgi:hypothetical protein